MDRQGPRRALGLFSGFGHWAAAMRKQGWEVTEYDIANCARQDLLDDGEFLELMGDIVEGKFRVVHVATDCTTWSLARQPPLRGSGARLWGLPGLCEKDAKAVREANELVRRSVVLCGVLVSFENLKGSRLRKHPGIVQVIADGGLFLTESHYCFWGCPWKKPT